jgi:hypothetical protein
MKNKLFILLLSLCITMAAPHHSQAQCAMCKQSAESSLKEGNNDAKGLNAGIMYLLMIPYLLVGGIGYYWYINNKKKDKEVVEE